MQKNSDLIIESDDIKISLAKCADYLDGINKDAASALDKVLEVIAEDIPGRYGPISQFDRLKHSEQVYNTKSTDPKQEKAKRNMNPSVKPFGLSGRQLQTRYCPDHNGVQTTRIGERTYQCPLDKKVYNYETGYTDYKGEHVPGGSIAQQTPGSSDYFATPSRIFDTRDNLMNPLV